MARKTIEQRIGLQGGKQILSELRNLGSAGEKAFSDIQRASALANSPTGRLAQSIGQLRGRFNELQAAAARAQPAFKRLNDSQQELGRAVRRTTGRIAAFTAGVAAAVVGLTRFTSAQAAVVDQAGKTAQGLGLAVDAYGRIEFAAEQSGVSASNLESGLTRLNAQIRDVANGNKQAAATFAQLGVQTQNADGSLRSSEAVLGDLAESFSRLPDGVEKSALAVRIFGRTAGPDLIPLLNEGRAGLAALGAEAERLGLVFSAQDVVIATAMQDSLNALSRARQGIQQQIALLFAPSITQGADALTERLAENSAAIIGFAEDIATRAGPVIEDFIRILSGQGDQIETEWLIVARDRVNEFASAVGSAIKGVVIPAFNAVRGAAQVVANVINAVFGTEFTDLSLLASAALLKVLGIFKLVGASVSFVIGLIKAAVAAFGLFGPAIAVVKAGFVAITSAIAVAAAAVTAFGLLPAAVVAAFVAAGIAIAVFWDDIVSAAGAAFGAIVSAATSAWDGIKSGAEGVFNFLSAQIDRLRAGFERLRDLFNRVRGQSGGNGGATPGFARGGQVRGPGTGTSDSILARLSNNEFVIRAAAVRKFGPSFFAALNNLRLPKFADGGLVSAMGNMSVGIPGFADGGLVAAPAGGGRPVTINFGGETFGVTADDDVVERLGRAATRRKVSSLGNRPGWYK